MKFWEFIKEQAGSPSIKKLPKTLDQAVLNTSMDSRDLANLRLKQPYLTLLIKDLSFFVRML